ncbi:MAG: tetratricopeptide repeat protein [Cryobacterium sp.]|nr:tetratricopeptide repeat protein [Cryobacterium sp.]MBX3089183.1 tetratricopeptide repeat protein [Cryobacterium sp.]
MSDQIPMSLRGAVDLTPLAKRAVKPATPGAGSLQVDSLVVEVSDATISSIVELSNTIPIVVEFYSGSPSATLEKVIRAYDGRFLLARADAGSNPGLSQAFQITAIPTVAAIIAGKPLPLYQGELPEEKANQVFDQVLAIAAENSVQGTVTEKVEGETEEAPSEEPLPPHHKEAFEAIERQDFDAAIAEYRKAIKQDPRDHLAVVGLAQVSLLQRLAGADPSAIRESAAKEPSDVNAQLAVADLDIAGGHLDDAFDRLLSLFPSLDPKAKEKLRLRLLEYFELSGTNDPRVISARRRLSGLLY